MPAPQEHTGRTHVVELILEGTARRLWAMLYVLCPTISGPARPLDLVKARPPTTTQERLLNQSPSLEGRNYWYP